MHASIQISRTVAFTRVSLPPLTVYLQHVATWNQMSTADIIADGGGVGKFIDIHIYYIMSAQGMTDYGLSPFMRFY